MLIGHGSIPGLIGAAAGPSCVGGNKAGMEQFSRMIVDGQKEGLLFRGSPPLVNGRVVLPEFIEAGSFPAAAGLGLAWPLGNEVGEVGADKGGNRFTMAFKAKANIQFIGDELEIRWVLQRYEIFEELGGCRWPIWPMVAPGELGAELRAVS